MAEIKHPDEKQVREDRFVLAYSSRGDTGKAWWPSMRLAWQSGSRLHTLQPNRGKETLAKTLTVTSSQEQ